MHGAWGRSGLVAAALLAAACDSARITFAGREGDVQTERKTVNLTDVYEERSVTVPEATGTATFRYRLLKPPGLGEADRRWPLVLFLHGAGERGDDNAMHLKFLPKWLAAPEMRERYPCFVLVPQCRKERQWVDVPWADRHSAPQAPRATTDLAAAVAALDDVLTKEPVDPARVYLTGLSMGGYGTWDLGARMPDRFAALLPICGGGDEQTATRLATLPIWCFHGDADAAVPVERSRAMIAALRAAGGKPKYSELPGVGHDSWTPAYRDPTVLDWLFEQSR